MRKTSKVVIKIGTKVITSKDRMLDTARIRELVDQVSAVKADGTDVIVVTSGAIGAGMGLLGLRKRPIKLPDVQATASIGQGHLMHLYSEYFKAKGHLSGQVLLTQEDFNDRSRYLNIKYTIQALLGHGAVPVINENDTVSTEEIKFGDNDRLASLVSDLCQVDKLIILTDVDGLLDEDCNVIENVEKLTSRVLKLARSSSCDLGTGGMASKLESIRRVTSAGIECVIANGKKKDVILKIMAGEKTGTTFKGQSIKIMAKKRWIAFSSRPKGAIMVDNGAKDALSKNDKSLLPSGILGAEGDFSSGDVIRITDKEGKEFARGLVNYSSSEILKIKGIKTGQIKGVLGYNKDDEVVHKDDLVIL
ncbi:MAG: glutamate 5-kinase [Candidatus Omnitrophota bacterium]